MTTRYLVDGPNGVRWSIWDHGNELSVCSGPELTSPVVAQVPEPIASQLNAGGRLSPRSREIASC